MLDTLLQAMHPHVWDLDVSAIHTRHKLFYQLLPAINSVSLKAVRAVSEHKETGRVLSANNDKDKHVFTNAWRAHKQYNICILVQYHKTW